MPKTVILLWVLTPGQKRNQNGKIEDGFKNLNDYKKAMIAMTKTNLVDIMLMSASVGEDLVQKKYLTNLKLHLQLE